MKDKLREAVDTLPDDAKAAVLVVIGANGQPSVMTPSGSASVALQVLGSAVSAIGVKVG